MTKRILLSGVFALLLATFAIAQDSQEEKSGFAKWTFDANVTALDFHTPQLKKFSSFKEKMAIGPDFTLTRHWSKVGLGLSANMLSPSISFLKEKTEGVDINKYLLMAGPGLVYNFQNEYLIKAESPVAPFIFANALASVAQIEDKGDKVRFGFGIPVGAGLYFKLADKVGLNVKAGYQFGVTDYYQSNVFWSAGATLGMPKPAKTKEEPQEFEPVVLDTDGDGIPDSEDECPDVPGLVEFNGCPDTDGDGIPDHLDECPEEAGPIENNGCPWGDADGDGVPDNLDECPEVPGPAENNGCPWPDTDGDGIPDHLDKCPEQAGPASNQGCPEIEEEVKVQLKDISRSIQFELGKSTLKKESYEVLDQVVAILTEYSAYNVQVEGHTDNTGSLELNEKLSAERAKVCADYLVSKGIDAERVSSEGFGPKNPVATNNTAAGRAENRRTEFKLSID